MAKELQIEFAALSDVGMARSANEDNMGHVAMPWGQIFMVCDGMGGHVGGAKASQIAVDSMREYCARDHWTDPQALLASAVSFANEQIYATALNQPELKGMGTTCVLLCQKETGIWLAHVGDSRIYLHSDRQLHRLTRDHSFVQGLVDQGLIQDEEAETHARKNELMRALGIGSDVQIEVTPDAIFPKKGDVFLLCSDGLNGMLGDRKIEEILNGSGSLEEKAATLIAAANEAGGMDNITVQLVQILDSPHLSNRYVPIKPPINFARTLLVESDTATPVSPTPPSDQSFVQKFKFPLIFAGVAVLAALLALSGLFGGNGKAEAKAARDKFVKDSLQQDSIAKVAQYVEDSTNAAELAIHVRDSLHNDSVTRKLIKPAKK